MRLSGWLRNPAPVDRFYRWFIPLFWGFNHPFGGAEFRNHDHQRTWLSSSVVINRRFLKMELHKIIMDIKRVPFRIEIHMKSMINWGSSLKICVTYRGTTKIWRFNAMQSYRLYHFWVCLKAGFKKKLQFSNFTGEFDDKTMSLGAHGSTASSNGCVWKWHLPPNNGPLVRLLKEILDKPRP